MSDTRRRSPRSTTPATLDLLVVGCGGGPLESDLSAYLVKSHTARWSEGCIALEAGSGIGAISQLLSSHAPAFADFELPSSDPAANALHILSLIKSYVISHAHLDHIAGLVISAGSAACCKTLFGIPRTLANLARVFDGGVWPALASWQDTDDAAYVYRAIEPGGPQIDVGAGLHARAMPVSHGSLAAGTYQSSAFFISIEGSDRQLLFFGDVEPDSLSVQPLNRAIWQEAAGLHRSGKLSAVFIECSYASDRPDHLLYGHLTPSHLYVELTTFARLLDPAYAPPIACTRPTRRSASPPAPLAGLTVYIMHIKRTPGAVEAIRAEVKAIEAEKGLGCSFVVLEQGMRLSV